MKEAEFKFQMDDWLSFQKDFMSRSKQYKKTRLIITYFLPAISIIPIYLLSQKPGGFYFAILFYGTASILWIIYYPKRFDKRTLKRTKKMLEEGDNSSYLGIHKIQFNEQFIMHYTKNSEQKIFWKGISKTVETKEYFFIYDTAASAIIIPKVKIGNEIIWALQDVIKTLPNKL